MSREAVIVDVAQTPIRIAFTGSLNKIKSPTLAAHAISTAIMRAATDVGEVEDRVMGTVPGVGTRGMNLGRLSALAVGSPVRVEGYRARRSTANASRG